MTHKPLQSAKCRLEIALDTIKNNYLFLQKKCPNTDVGAAVKANAYGLGVRNVAPILKRAGCRHFFVASCEEAVFLRGIIGYDANIYVFSGVFANELETFMEYGLVPILNHLSQIEIWQGFASEINRKLPCFLHLDTGMHRLGMPKSEIDALDLDADMYKLDILCIMSHLASADELDKPFSAVQLKRFKEYSHKFGDVKQSLANSSGIFLGQDYHFDLARPGAALYGINPMPNMSETVAIKNPVKLFAPIIQLHNLPIGESIGYNNTYTNGGDKSCPIATIPIGYADGLSRALSNKGYVYINRFKAPIIGRVSMDLITIDVSSVPAEYCFLGAPVEIIGDHCTPADIASASGTNAYEVLTNLGNRYERIYN